MSVLCRSGQWLVFGLVLPWSWAVLWGCCGGGVLLPLTFRISYSICADGLSSQIMFSGSSPVPFVFFTTIMSPLSYIYNPHRLAYLSTSALLVYSTAESERLHFIGS